METEKHVSDRNIILALSEDCANIYLASPEEDRLDAIKLNGFVPEGTDRSWDGLCYSQVLDDYINRRVYPDDRTMFREMCSCAHVIEVLSEKSKFEGTYRILDGNEIHYFSYKYVKISGKDEPLRVVAAFRDVDDIVITDIKKLDELRDLRNIIESSEMGSWHISVVEGRPNRMSVDAKMRELLGIPQDSRLTEEEIYTAWFSGIDPSALDSVLNSVKLMMEGKRDENTYKWHHPVKGESFVRCGGTSVPIPGGYLLSGYHYDVTEQVKRDLRYNMVIKSLARSYEFLNYIRTMSGTYITYADNLLGGEANKMMPVFKDVSAAIRKRCEEDVYETDREVMVSFSDLSTVNDRMKYRNVLIAQYRDSELVWHEWSYIVAERNPDGSIKHLIWADRKIDDEKQAEIRRQQILDDNIAANKAKTVFLQNMSHEIRTPLNAMFGFAQLLGLPEGTWSSDERDQYNSYILNSYNMLDLLIGDIIDIADSGHGNYRTEMTEVDVNSVCLNAVMSVECRRPAGVNLYYTSDYPEGHVIRTDGRRVQQVLINYLTNACKHTHEGEIHLHCSSTETPGRLTFSVTDTGTGVPADKADIIFNRFTKLNSFVPGSGLGLNICMMVASKLGGEVYLDKSYTAGARFVFVIDDTLVK